MGVPSSLNRTLQRPCSVDRVVADIGQPVSGVVAQLKIELALIQPLAQPSHLERNDLPELFPDQGFGR